MAAQTDLVRRWHCRHQRQPVLAVLHFRPPCAPQMARSGARSSTKRMFIPLRFRVEPNCGTGMARQERRGDQPPARLTV